MDKQSAINILARYREGNCTEEERRLVEGWLLHGAADSLDLTDVQLLEDLLDIRLRLERDLREETPIRNMGLRRWLPYVAAILIMGIVGTWMLWDSQTIDQKTENASLLEDVQPGGNRALLTLADGRTVDLSTAQSGIVVGDVLTYLDGTTILGEGLASDAPILMSISTPKGGTYQITLPDGSTVWLNSASKLTYPSQFDQDERIVELEGEAYFEVSKMLKPRISKSRKSNNSTSKQLPFLVKTRNQTVEVLGTEFNISAYHDEPEVTTTLVEGSVKVALSRRSESAPSTILKPGQQSIVGSEDARVSEVDVSAFVGWKEGYFIFNGTELHDAMRQLSRWYDVEVIYEGVIPHTPFYGKISRDDTLAEVLTILKEGKVNFRIEKQGTSNRLIVIP